MKILFINALLCMFSTYIIAQYTPMGNGELIQHNYLSLSYIESHEQAEWVYYTITKGNAIRTGNFRPDPKVSTASAALSNYKGTGYDRGHLCPAGSMKVNHTAMSQSFYMSNMSPQEPSFNSGIWKNLEALVREWGWSKETHVVTGPVFKDNKGVIGSNRVTVPGYYYKVIYQPATKQMIGFVLPNEKLSKSLSAFILSVDSIEALTGIDFFHQLDTKLQTQLESFPGDISDWTKGSDTSVSQSKNKGVTSSSQCKGVTKSTGGPCKSKTTKLNGYCHYHQKQAK